MWTPFVINVVLHHYASPTPFDRAHLPHYKEVVKDLTERGILLPNEFGYCDVTERGRALVSLWCETPIPMQKWVDPRFEEGGE